MAAAGEVARQAWRDPRLSVDARVRALMADMSLEEKIAQLRCVWLGVDSSTGEVAPHQGDMENAFPVADLLRVGLGQLTRPFGTNPVEPLEGARALAGAQRRVMADSRLGIPAMAHEECLAGLTAWQATCYPVPLSWGATFNAELVGAMAFQIGTLMASIGVHQGLAPVLDVARDLRWGRTEETIGEDPYLVGAIGTAYVKGLEAAGVVATLKHFAGYSTSRAARNLAPTMVGRREMADVILPPFEMAVIEGGARSVMPAYTDLDGVPMSMSEEYLTAILRDQWGFAGTVVADYFAIGFLKLLHGVAETWGDAARLALTAGVDVEMPNPVAYGDALVAEVEKGSVAESLIDRALERVLRQKCELGLLDADWDPEPACLKPGAPALEFDPPEARALARAMAEQAVVLVKNEGLLPLGTCDGKRLAIIGPLAEEPYSMLGCYSFPNHKGVQNPDLPLGVEIPTLRDALSREFGGAQVEVAQGCDVSGTDASGIGPAAELASRSDIVVLVLGDRAGMFGHGTSGEGCDAPDLALPGMQSHLMEAVLATGKPCVVIVVAGRPYALGSATRRGAAIVQSFFPGEEGAPAIAGVVSGRVNPSGRLPVSVPAHPGAQPSTYLGPTLSKRSRVSNIDPTPAYSFGHGLSYTPADWSEFSVGEITPGGDDERVSVPTDGEVTVGLTVANTSDRSGVEVVQLYAHRPVSSVVQPVVRLIGFARVELAAGTRHRVEFTLSADLFQFTGRDYSRIVESGPLELRVARSSTDTVFTAALRLVGPDRVVGLDRRRHPDIRVVPLDRDR